MASTTVHTSTPADSTASPSNRLNLVSFHDLDRSLHDTSDHASTSASSSKSTGPSKSGMFSKLMHRMRTTLHHATGGLDIAGLTGSSSHSDSSTTSSLRSPSSSSSSTNRSKYAQHASLPDVAEEIDGATPLEHPSMPTSPAEEQAGVPATASTAAAATPARLRITPPEPLSIAPLEDARSSHDQDSAASPDSVRSAGYFGFNSSLVNLSGSLITSGIKAVSSRYTDRHAPTSALVNEVAVGTPATATTTTATTATAVPRPPSLYGIHAPSTTSLTGGDFTETYGELGLPSATDPDEAAHYHQGSSSVLYAKSTYYASPMGRTTSASRELRRIRGEGISRDYWIKDEYAKYCYKSTHVHHTVTYQ
ncbi:hypothetical protein SYNPS1DRAFT_27642 [Syncephalis pseudoplumigaleata]|uniref:Uncharacterized protein n=1 Tax=Syncephalis pseudoplumigaleata TaxID=1712513 RepID=A0A4P9Z2C5_9FUNG|nr:hypothetical protein SYNPS1DRAFT_27642 [Syncephalis pseudoplumigaleata]|eukprot:RKP26677.1 hypothetical protein SYNPS1DRAFT_27642 [Syncephalis pseudoplumigaleata]